MPIPNDFEAFAASHLITMGVILGIALALPLAVRLRAPGAARPVAYLLAALLLAQEGIKTWMRMDIVGLSVDLLPLQLCTLTVYLSAWMLVTQDKRVFEVTYYWGLGGTTQALLTPDLVEGFPALSYLAFFLGHGATIVAVFFAMIVFRLRPSSGSLWRIMAITAAVAALAFVVNLWLGTNFMYLMAKPLRPSMLDWFGPWPWYLLGLIMLSIVAFLLLYLPFYLFDLSHRRTPTERR